MTDIGREHHDIQALVRGYSRKISHALFVYLRINDAADGRALLQHLGSPTNMFESRQANAQASTDEVFWNVAFTYRGLENLGVHRDILGTFPEDFHQGMEYRAADNGDKGRSAPENWDKASGIQPESYWVGRGIDAWLGYYGQDDLVLQWELFLLANTIVFNGWSVDIVVAQSAARLSASKSVFIDEATAQPPAETLVEHFGFNDAVTTPSVYGIHDNGNLSGAGSGGVNRVAGNGKLENGHWQPLAAGEFLFGHVDEVDEIPIAPQPLLLSHNGTFMVYRKLHQDVDGFRGYVEDLRDVVNPGSGLNSISADYIAAKMVGRTRHGGNFLDPYRINNFKFDVDPDGTRCPLGAHIRRVNPRDTLGFESRLINRHRILRRSFPYGELVGRGEDAEQINGAGGQGLVFLALNVSIARQFEFIQRQWINFGNDLNQGDDRDPVVGDNNLVIDADTGTEDANGHMSIPANASGQVVYGKRDQPAVRCPSIPRFVTTKGGDYFFLPSVAAVDALAMGRFSGANTSA